MTPPCPKCTARDQVVPIHYGMPSEPEFEKSRRMELYISGCVVTGQDPTHYCKRCTIKFDAMGRITIPYEDERGFFV